MISNWNPRHYSTDVYKKLETQIVPCREQPHTSTIIWLHGLGDSSEGFADMMPMVTPPTMKSVLPNAPNRPISVNMGMPSRAWYDIRDIDRGIGQMEDEKVYIIW